MRLLATSLALIVAFGSIGCRSFNGAGRAAAAHPAALLAGAALAAGAVAGAQGAFARNPKAEAQAEADYAAVEARVMSQPPAYLTP
jgi:hypothetical protein